MGQFHNQEIDIDTIHILFTFPQFYLYRFVCPYVFISVYKHFFFLPVSFQLEGHQTSFVFLLLEIRDRDFSHRNQNLPWSVLFPCDSTKMFHTAPHSSQQPPENRRQFGWFSGLVFCIKILYVKRVGFSLLSPHPPHQSPSLLSFCF